jgi:hypothetical protein
MTEDRNKPLNGTHLQRGTADQPYSERSFRPVNGEHAPDKDEEAEEEDLILGDEELEGDEEEYEIILEEDDAEFDNADYDEDDLVIGTGEEEEDTEQGRRNAE